ncbi:MAG TPA: hypothetical protein VN630_09440 [Rhodanobacteraceae bacterium]|nr:hypothetical protein [Rhodanobacteraceae bacterium]
MRLHPGYPLQTRIERNDRCLFVVDIQAVADREFAYAKAKDLTKHEERSTQN